MSDKELHRTFAVSCFNAAWDLIEKTDRDKAEDIEMIHLAHASRYHWGQAGTPLNFARGDWQISRVYAVLGFGVMSHKYAQSCLNLCEEHNFGDFDLAFAYEALARSNAVSGDIAKAKGYYWLAQETGKEIAKDEDRDYFFKELETISGFERA